MNIKIKDDEKDKIIQEIKSHLVNGGYLYELEDPDRIFRIMRSNPGKFKDVCFIKREMKKWI